MGSKRRFPQQGGMTGRGVAERIRLVDEPELLIMPQTFTVGSRSLLVSGLSALLMAAGVAGLWAAALLLMVEPAGLRLGLAAAAIALSTTALAAGLAQWLRHDWGRRLCIALLLLVMVALPLGLGLLLSLRGLLLAALVCGVLAWAAKGLMSRRVRQEFA